MAIAPGVQKSDPTPLEPDEAAALKVARAKVRELTTDRDRIQRKLDGAVQMLEHERADRRHALYIICDLCTDRINVMCKTAPPPDTHAIALLAVADAMKWTLSAATLGVIAASSNTPTRATTHAIDRCHNCNRLDSKETTP